MRRVIAVCVLLLSLLAIGAATTAPVSITTTALPDATIGQTYNTQLTATGGVQPYKWTWTGAPGGLSIVSSTGVLSGVPKITDTLGVHIVTVTATDYNGVTAVKQLSLQLNQAAGVLTIMTQVLPVAPRGAWYSFQLMAAYGVQPYTWSVSGLPNGLTCSAAGLISGTVGKNDSVGVHKLTVKVTDSASVTASRMVVQ